MSISIPDLLEGILEATAAEAAAKARIVAYRGALEDEGRRRMAADGAAPSWNAPDLGKVRLEPPGPWAPTVADPDTFASYVAEHHPSEATGVIRVPVEHLEDVLAAIGFALPTSMGGPATIEAAIEVRPAWVGPYLATLALDVEVAEHDDGTTTVTATAAETDTGNIVPGLTATQTAAKLVVALDRNRRTAVVEEARTSANAAIVEAIGDDQAAADLEALDVTRRELEALHGDQLAVIAKAHGLGSSGTKAALAERIARAEHASGRVIRPAGTIAGVPVMSTPLAVEHPAYDVKLNSDVVADLPPRREPGHSHDVTVECVPEGCTGHPRWAEIRATEAAIEAIDAAVLPPDDDPEQGTDEERERGSVAYLNDKRAAALMEGRSREVLRSRAKALGLSAAGTKRDVANVLAAAGITADDFNPTTTQERTP